MIVDLSVNAPGKKGGKLGDQIVNAEVSQPWFVSTTPGADQSGEDSTSLNRSETL